MGGHSLWLRKRQRTRMKHFPLVAIILQPFAMYLFLRVLELGFFVSVFLAAMVALFVGFRFRFIRSRNKRV